MTWLLEEIISTYNEPDELIMQHQIRLGKYLNTGDINVPTPIPYL